MPEPVESPLTARQVALLLGVHVNTVKRTEPSELPYFTIGTRNDRRYRPCDVRAYLIRRTVA
jgi:hypothetical protein